MKTRYFEIDILAPVENVYTKMLDKAGFEAWTAVFNPTSRLEGNWKVGSTMRFIATQEDGTEHGMLSRITENIPNKRLTMEHYGTLVKGKEITDDEVAQSLKGLIEQYIYTQKPEGTHLKVRTDLLDEWVDYMDETYPKALERLREICES